MGLLIVFMRETELRARFEMLESIKSYFLV